jgi:glycine cleavage system H protein
MNFPADVQYTETHEWMRQGADGVTVGLTDYAQSQLTDIVFVEVPEVDRHVDVGEEITSLESVKAVGYVYAPLTGIIVAVNEKLAKEPELINQDPYGEGWVARIQPDEPEETVELLDAAGYRRKVENPPEEEGE